MTIGPTKTSPPYARNGDEEKKSLATVVTVAVVALFVAVRLWRLSASCLWFDEIFSVHAARHGWAELLRFVAADIIHPPLFYLLLKIWISLGGESLLWLRLLPALVGIAAIIPFLLLCRELHLKQSERNLALLLLAVNGYLIKYAQELRMYSLLMFLSLCSLWLFLKLLRAGHASRKQVGWLLLVNLLLVYSHYAGWIVVVVQCLALVLRQRKKAKQCLIAFALLLLAYAPWVFLLGANAEAGKGLAQNIGWVTRPTLREITQFYALLNKPFWFIQSTAARPYDLLTAFFAILLLGVPLVFLSVRVWRRDVLNHAEAQTFRALFLFVLAPVIIVFGLSWVLPQSVWGTRHLIIVAAPYAILVSVAVIRSPGNWLKITVGLILGCWFLLAGVAWVRARPPVFIWCAWEPLALEVQASAGQPPQEVRIYAFEDLVAYHLWFAFDSAQRKQFKVAVVKGVAGIQEDPAYFLPRHFNEIAVIDSAQITGDEISIAYRAPQLDHTLPPLSTLESMGYTTRNVQSLQAQGQQAFIMEMLRR